MNLIKLAVLGLVLGNTYAIAECTQPEAPNLPDGASAAMEDMLSGQKAVKVFQEVNIEYMNCLEETFNSAESQVKSSSGDEKATAEASYEAAVDAYNAAVSTEEEMAGQFNTEFRAYKAANAE